MISAGLPSIDRSSVYFWLWKSCTLFFSICTLTNFPNSWKLSFWLQPWHLSKSFVLRFHLGEADLYTYATLNLTFFSPRFMKKPFIHSLIGCILVIFPPFKYKLGFLLTWELRPAEITYLWITKALYATSEVTVDFSVLNIS